MRRHIPTPPATAALLTKDGCDCAAALSTDGVALAECVTPAAPTTPAAEVPASETEPVLLEAVASPADAKEVRLGFTKSVGSIVPDGVEIAEVSTTMPVGDEVEGGRLVELGATRACCK